MKRLITVLSLCCMVMASTQTITLTITVTGYSVALTWNASTSANVTDYNVYRSTNGAAYQSIWSTPNTNYVDDAVQSGSSYTYYVTAVNSSGQESAPSSSVTVKIP